MRVFISYAREDITIAMKLYRDLKSAGVTPWMVVISGENEKKTSGLCGIWEDERDADEIVQELRSS